MDEGNDHVRNWRVLTAAVAAVAAVLAAVGVYFYLHKADQRAQSKVAQVSVLVASQPIPAGTTGATAEQKGWLSLKEVAKKDVPPGTLTSTSGLERLVAAYAIDNGGYITPSSFVAGSQVGDLSGTLDKGMEAISISVDDQHGVAGFVAPGDRISVIVSVRDADKTVTAYLVPGLKVLGVGSTTAVSAQASSAVPAGTNTNDTTATTQPANNSNKGLITVEVTPRQAAQIAHAYAFNGTLYVTLDPAHFNPKTFKPPTDIVDVANLFDQPLSAVAQSGTTTTNSGK